MKTLVLFLDAFKENYITKENTPVIFDLTKKYGLGTLKPVFGYSSIPAAFYTGFYPQNSNEFSVYKKAEKQNILYTFPLPNRFRQYFINFIRYLIGNDNAQPVIESKYFKDFGYSQEKYYHHKNAIGKKTLFNIFDGNNISYILYKWPLVAKSHSKSCLTPFVKQNDKQRTIKFIKLIKKQEYNFSMLYLWDLDHYGHKYGTKSLELKEKIRETDDLVGKVLKEFNLKEDNILLWSDHGMVATKKTLDIEKLLPKGESGYKYFLDSTVARFWFENEGIKQEIMGVLSKETNGKFITEEEKVKFKINFNNNKFFEEIFIVDPGVVIHPSFFHKNVAPKAMHTYDLTDKNEWGIFITNSKTKNYGETVDLFPTLLQMMGLKINYKVDGSSLLENV